MIEMLRAALMPIKALPAASRYPVWGPPCSVPEPQRRTTTARSVSCSGTYMHALSGCAQPQDPRAARQCTALTADRPGSLRQAGRARPRAT